MPTKKRKRKSRSKSKGKRDRSREQQQYQPQKYLVVQEKTLMCRGKKCKKVDIEDMLSKHLSR